MGPVITALDDAAVVAAVQFDPKLLQVEQNIATAQQLVYEAALKGASVIVLPELCTGGYGLQSPREALEVAQTKDGYQTQAFMPIAQQFGCHVVFGYVQLEGGKLYNSAAVVGPRGLEGNFQKHNLWGSDNLWAQPSEQGPAQVLTRAGRLGVLVCKDIKNNYRESYYAYNPKHRFYHKGDVDTIALLTNWGSAFAYPDSGWVDLVEETRANLIVSNRVGEDRDVKFKGGSAIIDRDRRIYTNGSSFTSEAVVGGVVLL